MSESRHLKKKKERIWEVHTADGAVIEYRIARTGVRVGAFLLDTMIRYLLLFGFFLLLYLIYGKNLSSTFRNSDLDTGLATAVLVLLDFLLQWGYFALFELYYSGQTPGKRLCGIQVLDRDGFTPSPSAVMLRNLIRFIDNLPFLHFTAVCVSSVDRLSRRIGDLVADTIVVYAKRGLEPFPVVSTARKGKAGRHFAGIGRLQETDVYYIRRFLEGQSALNSDRAEKLAEGLALKIADKIGFEGKISEPQKFLERVQDEYAASIQE